VIFGQLPLNHFSDVQHLADGLGSFVVIAEVRAVRQPAHTPGTRRGLDRATFSGDGLVPV